MGGAASAAASCCCCCCPCVGGHSSLLDTINSYAWHNLTDRHVAVAVYWKVIVGDRNVERGSDIIFLKPGQRLLTPKPDLRVGWLRKGVVMDPALPKLATRLSKSLTAKEWASDLYNDDNVMDLELQHALVIYERKLSITDPKVLVLTNPAGYAEYQITSPLIKGWEETRREFQQELLEAMTDGLGPYRYAHVPAQVTMGSNLSEQEAEFTQTRMAKVRVALGKFLRDDLSDIPLDRLPRIAIACSGGGYRAMLASLGVLVEFEKLGLLDCVTHISGLSGGSWSLLNVYASGARTFAEALHMLRAKIEEPFLTPFIFPTTMMKELRERLLLESPLGIVDDFSWLIHHHWMRDWSTHEDLWNLPRVSEQAYQLQNGDRPLPIYSAVTTVDDTVDYRWVELTPFTAGIADDINAFVPMFAFGRRFNSQGSSVDATPEPSVALVAATCGSAFCATVDQMLQNTVNDARAYRAIRQFLHKDLHVSDELFNTRLVTPCKFFNFIPKGKLGMDVKPLLNVLDAGCHFNIPLPPLLRREREIDIILALDQSAGQGLLLSDSLPAAQEYAKKFNLPFPDIKRATEIEHRMSTTNPDEDHRPFTSASTRILTVCPGDVRTRTPSILYMPLLANPEFDPTYFPRKDSSTSTFDFSYTKKECDQLTGLAGFNARAAIKDIQQHILTVLRNKMKLKAKQKPRGATPYQTVTVSAKVAPIQ